MCGNYDDSDGGGRRRWRCGGGPGTGGGRGGGRGLGCGRGRDLARNALCPVFTTALGQQHHEQRLLAPQYEK
jgi:hypothetical protein